MGNFNVSGNANVGGKVSASGGDSDKWNDYEDDIDDLRENQRSGWLVFETYALMIAQVSPDPNAQFKVTSDPNKTKNGYYHWNGSVFIKDDPLVNGAIEEGEVDGVSGDTAYEYIEPIKEEIYGVTPSETEMTSGVDVSDVNLVLPEELNTGDKVKLVISGITNDIAPYVFDNTNATGTRTYFTPSQNITSDGIYEVDVLFDETDRIRVLARDGDLITYTLYKVVYATDGLSNKVNTLESDVDLLEEKTDQTNVDVDDINDNLNGELIPVIEKIATGNFIDFDIDGEYVLLQEPTYFKCKNGDGSIPASVNIDLYANDVVVGQTTMTLDIDGYGDVTVTNNSVDKFRLVNISTGFEASVLSSKDTIGVRLDNAEVGVSLNSGKLNHINETYTSNVTILEGEKYEKCVFSGINVYVSNSCTIRDCDFVNSIILSTQYNGVKNCNIVENKFIGDNSRIVLKAIYDSNICNNDFPISDSRYPSATPKTTGESSRNIYVNSMARCNVIGNKMYTGRNGITVHNNTATFLEGLLDEFSSVDNVISGNITKGIGEEHISFDNSYQFDLGTIDAVSVSFVEIVTDQLKNGAVNDTDFQTKIVSRVTLSITTDIFNSTGFEDNNHIKEYPSLLRGFFGIGLKNSKYYKVVDINITGTIANDPNDGMDYSVDGTYDLTIEIPTFYDYNITMTPADEIEETAYIMSDWSVGDEVAVNSICSKNIISDNIIEGIGTGTITNISDMGGIVLYSMCFHNVVNNNMLRQKRIWLQQWKNESAPQTMKIRMQSYNTISNNTVVDTSISLINMPLAGYDYDTNINRGNRLIGNIVSGNYKVAGIRVESTDETVLIGNTSNYYQIIANDRLKLVANSKGDSANGEFTNNTNVLSDTTDEIQI